MKSALDITEIQIELLKTMELEQVCRIVDSIVVTFSTAQAVGILIWDEEIEAFSEKDTYTSGPLASELSLFLSSFTSKAGSGWNFDDSIAGEEFDASGFSDELKQCLLPLLCFKIRQADGLIALIFAAGGDTTSLSNRRDLQASLQHFAVHQALKNTFQVAELRREADRLRTQYEQLEEAFHMQKEAAAGLPPAFSFRVGQTDKEKLVYEISNSVRSSLEIEDVLQTSVNKIGATFQLSRCLVLWPIPDADEYRVYEWFHEVVPSVKDQFFTDAGRAFVKLASSKTAPTNFAEESDWHMFDKAYLSRFGFLSGILVPLIYHDRNIGSLFLQDCATSREWSIDNTALIGSLADLISVAIEHSNMHEEKKKQAVTDGLTGIANRRSFNENLDREFERARRYGHALSLVVVDLDYLKRINDTFGHHVGDEAIKAIGKVLARESRAVDTAARYGGEEFCLLLPDTDAEDAVNLAERIRKLIAETDIAGPGNVSASIGVATFPAHADSKNSLFEAADQALYVAKQTGRNRVCIAVN